MKVCFAMFTMVSLVACGGTVTPAPSATSDGGTVGDGGTAGDGSTASDATAPTTPATCLDCLTTTVSWEQNGGRVAYVDTSTLAGCRTYGRSRTSSGTPTFQCTGELGACGAAPIAVAAVATALAHPDVTAALASDTTSYGSDTRPCDGSLLNITVGAKTIGVGDNCLAGSTDGCSPNPCVPVPAGVRALANLLEQLDAQEIAKPACAAFK